MILWPFFCLFFIVFSNFFYFLDISFVSDQLHNGCLEKLNFHTPFSDIYKSLVCGQRLPYKDIRNIFTEGGLIHLTVVSGAHLLFLEKFWRSLPIEKNLKTYGLFIVLILYALTSRMHPPVVRALFSFFLFRISDSLKLFWNAGLINILSGLFCLIYKPSWVNSLSLQLSLLASFLQNFSSKSIIKCFFIYLFLVPIVNRWQTLHPVTIIINWILAPFIGSLLFPLSFISPFFPALYKLTDWLWSLVLKALSFVSFLPSQSPVFKWVVPQKWIWHYICFIGFAGFLINLYTRRLDVYKKKK